MKHINIDRTDIFLDDMGEGRGKITISSYEHGAFTHYWGSMGTTLKDFILKTDSSYFVQKLSRTNGVFDAKKTVSNIRKYIREDMKNELPWYKWMGGQKEFREKLRYLEGVDNADMFIIELNNAIESLLCIGMDYEDEKEFKQVLQDYINCEPWYAFFATKPSREELFLSDLHEKIKNELRVENNQVKAGCVA